MDALAKYNPPQISSNLFEMFEMDHTLSREEYAFDIWNKLIMAKQVSEALFIVQGRLLKEIRDDRLYEVLDYPNFTQFINSEEISFSREKAYLYIRIYEYFIETLKINPERVAEMSIARLGMMLPHLKKMDDEEAIEKMQEFNAMRHNDFVKDIKKIRTGGKPNVYWSEEIEKWIVQYYPKITQLITLNDEDLEDKYMKDPSGKKETDQ